MEKASGVRRVAGGQGSGRRGPGCHVVSSVVAVLCRCRRCYQRRQCCLAFLVVDWCNL